MNNSVYLIVFVIGFAIAKVFEYLLDMDARKYADIDMEIMKAIEEEKEEEK